MRDQTSMMPLSAASPTGVVEEPAQLVLAEVRHRVSNDLALVALRLEAERDGSAGRSGDEVLDAALGAVMSLAIYYRNLYGVSPQRFVDLGAHLDALLCGLCASYLDRLQIKVTRRFAEILTPSALARDVGIIAVELIANAAKHAFARNDGGRVWVDLKKRADGLTLQIVDDGRGMSPQAHDAQVGGLRFAHELARQLGGRLHAESQSAFGGAAFTLVVPHPSAAERRR